MTSEFPSTKHVSSTCAPTESESIKVLEDHPAEVISLDQNPFKTINTLLKPELTAVNELILKELQSEIPLIPELAGHLVASGGKRVRPLLTLASAKIMGASGDRANALAAAVEFIHTATLLHDDVVDQSDLRRGNPSANSIWGNSASVLVGDFLFSRAFQLMVQTRDLEILRVLSDASARITEGEVMQLIDIGNLQTSVERYEQVIERKTAALFDAACRSGAMLATSDERSLKAFSDFGKYFGVTFQIVDDVFDYRSDQDAFGKNMGDDLREKKVTLPVLITYNRGTEAEKKFWEELFDLSQETESEQLFQEHMEQAYALILKHNGFDAAFDSAKRYAARALESLESIRTLTQTQESHQIIDILMQITRFSLSRTK